MLSGFDKFTIMLFFVSCIILFGYFWYLFVWVRRFEEFEEKLIMFEKDSKSIHKAIEQLNKNQKLFIKRGEHVIIYRQEEKFEQGQGDA